MTQSVLLGVDRPATAGRTVPIARLVGWALFWLAIAAALIFFIFPIFWMLETSFKTVNEANAQNAALVGFQPTLDNYHNVFLLTTANATSSGTTTTATDFPRYFLNSIVIGAISTLLALILGTLAAYGFSRFRVVAKNDLLFFILSQRMLPPIALLIPIFLMYPAIG